jgi:hypothetical protein
MEVAKVSKTPEAKSIQRTIFPGVKLFPNNPRKKSLKVAIKTADANEVAKRQITLNLKRNT